MKFVLFSEDEQAELIQPMLNALHCTWHPTGSTKSTPFTANLPRLPASPPGLPVLPQARAHSGPGMIRKSAVLCPLPSVCPGPRDPGVLTSFR